ncbi:MAG: hypothetical protein KDM91_00040 [Verrucomicrobiae bacterium]|nr:hypothetical protein [Verrucomicrobiae bacterium]MCP5538680.1 hypothetical protein [Akkermansiaceae bacterium]
MTHVELRSVIDHGVPLTLFVADGRKFDVPHRDFVWLPPRSTVVTVAIVATPSPMDTEENVTHIIPLLMVSSVSVSGKPVGRGTKFLAALRVL